MSRTIARSVTDSIHTSCQRITHAVSRQVPIRTLSTSLARHAKPGDITDSLMSFPQQRQNVPPSDYGDISGILSTPLARTSDPRENDRFFIRQPHRFHVYATKHNTHITLTAPTPPPAASKGKSDPSDAYKPPEPNRPLMSFATGMIGFRKAGRGTYDAAYQLASYVLKQIQERGLQREIREIEVVLRGFGAGREAVTKAILGQEGRFVRPKISAVTDATRLKFGGSRSPNPRRLG
ncbi:hypothetical protein BDZ85DRAFT_120925 [Elsinoe ampelina]|uniref:Mitochondrial ribosomal protein subunit S18 n=1 Tax=Elsinoe ampelina TaxID=302913 RepID=A0A6A6GBE6_9PEZI|nr:hypothetical protein BDZ85DRAFT_120925 [Elsinoe ampelina]